MSLNSIVITGANGQVGRITADSLGKGDRQVTALVRKKEDFDNCITIGDWLTSPEAVSAIQRAEALIHLAGALNPPDHDYQDANIAPTQKLIEALEGGCARRIIFLSYVGASENSKNQYLSSKAKAERLLQETKIPLTVLRCTHIIGPPGSPGPTASQMLLDGKRSVPILGNGKQLVAPVYIGDVVSAILAALQADINGTFDLQGPDEMTINDLVRLLNNSEKVRISHLPGTMARFLKYFGPKLPGALIDVMLHDSRSKNPTAAKTFNLSLTSLEGIWDKAPLSSLKSD